MPRIRLLSALILVTVVAAAAPSARAVAVPRAPAAAAAPVHKPLWQEARDYWTNMVAPRVERATPDQQVEGGAAARTAAEDRVPQWWLDAGRKYMQGFPPAARELGRVERLAATTGRNPASLIKRADETQTARLLTLLVEFNPEAADDFSGWERPNDPSNPDGCVTEPPGTTFSGPLHNQLPDPATRGSGQDNNTFWVPDFSPSHYDALIFSTTGLTQRVRPDLTGPDGRSGVDLSGYTVRNHYMEMSRGGYEITGEVSPWLLLPHSEAWYSADSCAAGAASDVGHPDNPRGTGQMAVDAVEALAAAQPDFPWADYDVEDQGDADGDGDLFEPDGALDHVVLIHAGDDQAGGGGEQGTYAEWSSASVVDPSTSGYAIGDTGVRLFNYIVQAEDAGVGVVSHEFGHDLGLPDLYDVIGPTETDVGFWDLMSTGSHSGPLFQTIPAHMGAWSKYVLGWTDPVVLQPGDAARHMVVGQASRTPVGTRDGARVNLPAKTITLGEPHSGEQMWWSNQDQSWADVRLRRTVEVPSGADVRFWMWNDYVIEEFWDYGFVEVSTDGGATWAQLVVRDEAGNVVSTSEDPNLRLADYGGLVNGLTGTTGGWRHDWVDLTPYAGGTVELRLRYATDAAFEERGWFADDFAVTADGAEVFTDDVESGADGWTAEVASFTSTTGAGWIITSGEFVFDHYYLAEWRNYDGFDEGLRYPYDTNFLVDGEWNVNRNPYNAPGLLVWYRDQQYTFNSLAPNLLLPPSIGAKGLLLLVDSHFDPLRRQGEAAAVDPSLLDNLSARVQASNAAFGVRPTTGFQACLAPPEAPRDVVCNDFGPQEPVRRFTDAQGWYPGIEYRPDLDPESPLFFRDSDASVVVPSEGNEIYSTRIVDAQGQLLPELYGTPVGGGHVLGTGNPADGRPAATDGSDPGTEEDLSVGVVFVVRRAAPGNVAVLIEVTPAR